MSRISYPDHPVLGHSIIPVQPLPKNIHDICRNLGIEPDFSMLEMLRPVKDRVAEAKEEFQNHPTIEKRKKSELLHQANEEIIAELTRRQNELEQQRLDDVEAGEQNLETLEELASIKTKLEILTEENRKLNQKVFDNLHDESYAYATVLMNQIRDDVYNERCELRGELLEKIEQHFTENSSMFAQFCAIDAHVDFSRIESEVQKELNI